MKAVENVADSQRCLECIRLLLPPDWAESPFRKGRELVALHADYKFRDHLSWLLFDLFPQFTFASSSERSSRGVAVNVAVRKATDDLQR